MASADLLLHPVRLRIVQAFLGDRALTTAQLADELGDVPPASLYRHVSLLTKAGVLAIAAERRVRAVVERTYVLRLNAARIQPDEMAAMTPEQHLAAFMAYAAGMLADVERYLTTGTPDPLHDGARSMLAAMWLNEAEYTDLVRDLGAVFQPRLANGPGRGRKRRTVYNVLVPASEGPRARRAKSEAAEQAGSTSESGSGSRSRSRSGSGTGSGERTPARKAPASRSGRRRKEAP